MLRRRRPGAEPGADGLQKLSKQFAENMRRPGLRRGLSQEEIAYACGLERTEISLLERGERDPRLSTVVHLARAMDFTASSLLEASR